MSEEEKKAIEVLKDNISILKKSRSIFISNIYKNLELIKAYNTILNLINKQQKELEKANEVLDDMRNDIAEMTDTIQEQQKELEIWKETENDYEHELARKDEEIEELKKEIIELTNQRTEGFLENERLQKEIEELIEAIEEWVNGERINDIKHISKDKIKEKIKDNLFENDNGCGVWWYQLDDYVTAEEFLNELLEE